MERTFAYRRQEVVKDMPFIAEFKNRWPALFSESQVKYYSSSVFNLNMCN